MSAALNISNTAKPTPIGCAPKKSEGRLSAQYGVIGSELLRYEYGIRSGRDRDALAFDLRTGLAFVSVEILESYLEDLLDLSVSENRLGITLGRTIWPVTYLSFAGLVIALALGLFAASTGASLLLAFALTGVIGLPFGMLWHYAPRDGLSRRVLFGQVLSHEIARRRGTFRDDRGAAGTVIRNLIVRRLQRPVFSPLSGAAALSCAEYDDVPYGAVVH